MHKYIKYINFFNKQIPKIINQDRGCILKEIPYDLNKNNVRSTISIYTHDNPWYDNFIIPDIKNNNDMHKLNGSFAWLNLLNSNFKDTHIRNIIWLSNPNLHIFNNYIDSSQLDSTYEFIFYDINIKYAKQIEEIYNKLNSKKSKIKWNNFFTEPKYYCQDNIIHIHSILQNNDLDLKLHNFKYPHFDSNNCIKLNRIYYVNWNNTNISKFIKYLYEWNENAKTTDRLYVIMTNFSENILHNLNIELYNMKKLKYKLLIRVPDGFVVKNLHSKYWNNGFITDCRSFL